ncbi:hypothetical protein K466DRAFT_72258 [Polyporus arcularius HHB13444]|uniref:Uncharacterized protein n=1 Tax=Polyporus arcularius HHB13444 TaxID=1314778 RepID=A0A5C3Q0S1_9APHY|nr:hypothetical protein K466DRAFT_72258 [Polyporus arcularius HHB13444]
MNLRGSKISEAQARAPSCHSAQSEPLCRSLAVKPSPSVRGSPDGADNMSACRRRLGRLQRRTGDEERAWQRDRRPSEPPRRDGRGARGAWLGSRPGSASVDGKACFVRRCSRTVSAPETRNSDTTHETPRRTGPPSQCGRKLGMRCRLRSWFSSLRDDSVTARHSRTTEAQ